MSRKFPIDDKILQFINTLNKNVNDERIPPRINKAISMFRREKNLLYVDKDDDSLKAVIKSQTKPNQLEYAISLKSNGDFFCGTQNLYPCGGLRGKVCKHIILALIAVIKSGVGTQNEMIKWVGNTLSHKPKFIKPEATEIFIKYKYALEGKIEWRPIEVLPEDFMAF
ncbi:MAG: hypothetical protein ACFE9T_10225 [Promethearchaeota archaeon]